MDENNINVRFYMKENRNECESDNAGCGCRDGDVCGYGSIVWDG